MATVPVLHTPPGVAAFVTGVFDGSGSSADRWVVDCELRGDLGVATGRAGPGAGSGDPEDVAVLPGFASLLR